MLRLCLSNLRINGFLILIFQLIAGDMNAQDDTRVNFAQYLFPSFSDGIVRMKAGSNSSASMNYNTVTEKMVFERRGEYYDMTNQEAVDTVYLQGKKFIPFEKIFLEVVVKDKISLLLQNRSTLQAPGVQVGYGGTSELTSSKYLSGVQMSTGYYNLELPEGYNVKPSPAFWVGVNEEFENFFNERQFLKIFPGLEEQLKPFIKQNKIKTDRIEDLVKLVQYCNELEK